jgi:hypothetical protein
MIDASIRLRVARSADADKVGALLAASYSSLLGARYDSDTLGRALPHMTEISRCLNEPKTCVAAQSAAPALKHAFASLGAGGSEAGVQDESTTVSNTQAALLGFTQLDIDLER